MKLIFSPVRMDQILTASVAGDVLTLNGAELDFGPMPRGAILPRTAIDSPWIAGDVMRDREGILTVPLILPHGANAPHQTLFPQSIEANDGPVPLPDYEVENVED